MQIYYNSDCSKCREALYLLQSNGVEAEVIDYLNKPPSFETLKNIVVLLGVKPEDLVRKSEPLFDELKINNSFSDEDWINLLIEYPILIQRPIIIEGQLAIIGRPPERIFELISNKIEN